MPMLAIVSDIHGNLPALEAVIADAEARGCTGFSNLGDLVSGPLWPAETAARLRDLGWPTLRGNHERQLQGSTAAMGASDRFARDRIDDATIAWMGALPTDIAIAPGIVATHGTPTSDLDYLLEDVGSGGATAASPTLVAERLGSWAPTARIILCGHSHQPRVTLLADGRAVANPGSVGLPAFAWDRPLPHVMEAGTPQARYATIRDGVIELHAVDYDHRAAAAKAERERFAAWAQALRTGRAA